MKQLNYAHAQICGLIERFGADAFGDRQQGRLAESATTAANSAGGPRARNLHRLRPLHPWRRLARQVTGLCD